MPALDAQPTIHGRRWTLRGQVQGVGFRPFVCRIATRLGLKGQVWNDSRGVVIEAAGRADQLDRFGDAIVNDRPTLATFDSIEVMSVAGSELDQCGFVIAESQRGEKPDAAVAIDTPVCEDCLTELFDPKNRRHRYGLINCTNCGPRYTITTDVPYDRPNTSMADFPMCDACRREYTDPTNRRFHAQPVCCPDCGPRVRLVEPSGRAIGDDPYHAACRLLRGGGILAIKGLGGFHLAVRADQEHAVSRLRRLKQRDHKPLAVMAADMNAVNNMVAMSDSGSALLQSPSRPVVLALRRSAARVAEAVAPRNHRLGVLLPYTPIQHMVMRELASDAADPIHALVLTSANSSDEPLVTGNDEAFHRLAGLCDALLLHDRPIVRAVDDSVLVDIAEDAPLPIRRARGEAPRAIRLPIPCDQPGLCLGGELKNTVAVVRHGEAILSQHIGDLKHPLAFEHFNRIIGEMCSLFGVQPRWIAHDMHPQYLSTRHATRLAAAWRVPCMAVQHHHAHAASLMAEHGESSEVLNLVADGVGFGDDRSSWGGELLRSDLHGYKRLMTLAPLNLPGGDAAATDTRRCALALLQQAFGHDGLNHPITRSLYPDRAERSLLTTMLAQNVACTTSTALGRVFDGYAALLGVCLHNRFEAEAPMALESLAAGVPSAVEPMRHRRLFHVSRASDGPGRLDLGPLTRQLLSSREAGTPTAMLSAMLHDQLAKALDAMIARAVTATDLHTAGLTGGVFCNQRLTESLSRRLRLRGLRVLRHSVVPANDGGLALGQAAIASARLATNHRNQDVLQPEVSI